MAETVESRVVALVAKECGQSPETLTLDDTLVDDLGMTGDDAIVFFEIFRTEFSTDLNDLYQDWHSYFPRRKAAIGTGIVFALPIMALTFLFMELVPRFPKFPAFLISFFLWLVLLVVWSRSQRGETPMREITIQDLIDTAHARRWMKSESAAESPQLPAEELDKTSESSDD